MVTGRKLADEEDLHAVFEWLGWSAPKNSPVAQALDAHFPGAIPGSALASRLTSVLLHDHQITAKNTLFGTSICADEINSESGDMADQLRSYFGKVFPMGGIGGAPFAGKTGFAAFSHHVPDGGHVVILFGPHVGISKHGEVGKYHRVGQEHESAACGALTAALASCRAGQHGTKFFDSHDAQQSWLRDNIAPVVENILSRDNSSAALALAAYDIIEHSINQVVNTDFGYGKLVLVGGVQINIEHPYEDHFLPMCFEVRQQSEAPLNMLDKLRA